MQFEYFKKRKKIMKFYCACEATVPHSFCSFSNRNVVYRLGLLHYLETIE